MCDHFDWDNNGKKLTISLRNCSHETCVALTQPTYWQELTKDTSISISTNGKFVPKELEEIIDYDNPSRLQLIIQTEHEKDKQRLEDISWIIYHRFFAYPCEEPKQWEEDKRDEQDEKQSITNNTKRSKADSNQSTKDEITPEEKICQTGHSDLHIIATGSIVRDDRDMGKKLSLAEAIWIGGINVHRDFRGQGIGIILFAYIDNYIQKMIKTNITVDLFTNNLKAKHIYKRFGFKSKGFIQNDSIIENDPEVS
ncbi:unnamed protein product [Rotaria sp. Silwood1]|nr:unnamed protein product [Rotaria sp. Silwood1]